MPPGRGSAAGGGIFGMQRLRLSECFFHSICSTIISYLRTFTIILSSLVKTILTFHVIKNVNIIVASCPIEYCHSGNFGFQY